MTATVGGTTALGDNAARQLANATKTVPQLETISPRWLTHLLQWVPVEAGIYRVNKVRNPESIKVTCTSREEENQLPRTFVDYEENPREHYLNAVSTVLDVHTRISDLYSSPHDQIKEQLRLTIETIKENQESELINNPDYGLLAQVSEEQRIFPLTGAPTPDDLDELLTKALATVNDQEREKLLAEAMKVAIDDVALVPLHYEVTSWATRKGLSYEPRPDQYTLAYAVRSAK